MMRSLWTGASGMIAQQTSLDNIANNLSNVNTAGYKKEETSFQSLLYSKLQTKVTDNEGNPKPVIGQVGAGVKVASIRSIFKQGGLNETGNPYDMAIDGNGFFMVRTADGSVGYTRNGAFGLALSAEGGVTIANSDGYTLLNTDGEPIQFDSSMDMSKVEIDVYGNLCYPDENGDMAPTEQKIALAQFNDPTGLLKLSGSLYQETAASGEPRIEGDDEALKPSRILTSYLEASNVQTADEIVNLIVTQRAYEMNSKVITASDEMLQQANNLRG